ncbi:sulfotransferase [Sphingopyxis sp. BSNA05]|uniref:sulfotransferase domain-containing protein n=1 Tax=Sphingopyxis sp. BSNA05 TaxID=1236614 RepID=UPI0015657C72|nr:sulfotransferase [Sphingopyxis sp. BSNA05]
MGAIYWLSSYPKSGNTWFRTFLQNLTQNGDAPVDINELHTGSIASGRGWLDEVLGFDTADMRHDDIDALRPAVYDWSLQSPDLEYHKIHDAYTFLPSGEPLVSSRATRGAVYFVRNPLDVASSFANHLQCSVDDAIVRMASPKMSFVKSEKRLNGQVRQKLFSWSDHVLSWVDAPDLNLEILRYEDMLEDSLATFTRAARFLELPHDQPRVEKAIHFSRFDRLQEQEKSTGFKEKPANTPSFFRQGKSGGWRQELNEEQITRIIADHGPVMRRFNYLDEHDNPL